MLSHVGVFGVAREQLDRSTEMPRDDASLLQRARNLSRGLCNDQDRLDAIHGGDRRI
jgi:hypothetical protein